MVHRQHHLGSFLDFFFPILQSSHCRCENFLWKHFNGIFYSYFFPVTLYFFLLVIEARDPQQGLGHFPWMQCFYPFTGDGKMFSPILFPKTYLLNFAVFFPCFPTSVTSMLGLWCKPNGFLYLPKEENIEWEEALSKNFEIHLLNLGCWHRLAIHFQLTGNMTSPWGSKLCYLAKM